MLKEGRSFGEKIGRPETRQNWLGAFPAHSQTLHKPHGSRGANGATKETQTGHAPPAINHAPNSFAAREVYMEELYLLLKVACLLLLAGMVIILYCLAEVRDVRAENRRLREERDFWAWAADEQAQCNINLRRKLKAGDRAAIERTLIENGIILESPRGSR